MAQIFLTDINLRKNELQNAAIQNLATAPASPVSGQIYFDTADAEIKVWDGSAWIGMGGDITSITAGLGLTGTAASGDVTLDVGAGSGITVNADTIDVRYDNTSIELDGNGDLSLKATGVTAATYGSATAIPTFTVDADGRLTSAGTASISTSLSVAGDIADGGDMNIDLATETLTIAGTADEIETIAGYNNTASLLKIGLPSNVTVSNNLTVINDLSVAGGLISTNNSFDLITANADQLLVTSATDGNAIINVEYTTGLTVGSASQNRTFKVYGGATITGDTVIEGNLTVSGAVTTKLSEEVLIEDNIITLNSNETGSATENAGINVERGTDTNVNLIWDESNDKWKFTNDGTNHFSIPTSYKVAIGDGVATSYTITDADHHMGTDTSGFMIQLVEISSGATVFADVTRSTTTAGDIVIGFASAPSTNSIRVIIINAGY